MRRVENLRVIAAIVLVAASLASAPPMGGVEARQARGRALTIEDYYRVQGLGTAAISPDAAWVVFTTTTRVEADNSTATATFVVPSSSASAPRRVQHEGADVASPGWTDAGHLRYTAAGATWTLDLTTPGAAPVRTASAGGAGRGGGRGGAANGAAATTSIASPDGRWIATIQDRPEPIPPPPPMTDFEKRHNDRFKGAIFDWMLFQRDGQPFPAPDPTARPAQELRISQAGVPSSQPIPLGMPLRPTGLVWHPSGQQVAFLADPVWRDETKYERPDIFLVSVDRSVTRLTDDGHVHGDLKFSPDGKYLSYSRTFGTDMIVSNKLNHGGPDDLLIRPVAGGAPINLTANWDLEPGPATWSPDSRYIYFSAAKGGENHLFRVSVPDARVEQVTKGPRRVGSITFDKAVTTMAYTVSVHEAPPDVYVSKIDGSGERRLSDMHREFLTEVALGKTDTLSWKSRDGTVIEGWLTHPHRYDRSRGPYPLIVFSHGGPHSATGYTFDFKKQFFAANGYFVLDTNFRSSTGYGDAFKWATWGAWGTKDGQDVMSGIDHVIATYPIDAKRVGHTGHSYGGFMTNWLITQYPDRLAAAVSGAGITNWSSDYGTADIFRTKETEFFGPPWDRAAAERMMEQSPLTHAGRVRTPTLFVHGEVDQRVPYEEGEQMYFALKRRGVPAMMIQYAGQPHGIAGHWNNVHRMLHELKWWETYLKPAGR